MFTASLGLFLFGLLAAYAGGFLGAAIGGNFAFVLTGFAVFFAWAVFMATGSTWGFGYVAFGPFAGPYVMFAGGAAAAAFAWSRGYLEDGKDINAPLAGLGRPVVMHVGGLFGVFGYLCQIGISKIPWFGGHTDSVALTVVISALIARLLFGKKAGQGMGSITNPEKYNNANGFMGKIAPNENSKWLPWQEKWSYLVSLGMGFGMAAGAVSIVLAHVVPGAVGNANTFVFAISAIIILFLIMGFNMPVQHHITNIAGFAAVTFLPALAGHTDAGRMAWWNGAWGSSDWMAALGAVIIAGIFGVLAGWLCEFFARVWYDRGTTHVDPPASAIWIMNTIVATCGYLMLK